MDLAPRHRLPIRLPGPWPPRVAAWLCSGDRGASLFALQDAVFATRWQQGSWRTTLEGTPLLGSPWEALEACMNVAACPWMGAATYELACDEAGLPRKPLLEGTLGQHWRAVWEAIHVEEGRAELWSWQKEAPDPEGWLAGWKDGGGPVPGPVTLTPAWGASQHHAAVEGIRSQILDGAFYVANLCVPFEGRFQGDPLALAKAAFDRARPPFGAWLDLEDLQLVSLSMERLLARRGDRLWSQPIKGSAPWTGDLVIDQAAARALLADPKERAEHTMILDLVRNDLGRVARPGTVRVGQPMAVETFPTVQHLVSRVEATALPGLGLADLLRAVLPGGSVTGAPKHAVCRHLAEVEAGPRGFYCGAVGWLAPNGDLDLALPIRTAQVQGERITYWAGGGITRRSDAAREWAELHLKTRAIVG